MKFGNFQFYTQTLWGRKIADSTVAIISDLLLVVLKRKKEHCKNMFVIVM